MSNHANQEPNEIVYVCSQCQTTLCMCASCTETEIRKFYFKDDPKRTVCKPCYYRTYGVKNRPQIYETRRIGQAKQRAIMKVYRATPRYTEIRQELRNLKREYKKDVSLREHELMRALTQAV